LGREGREKTVWRFAGLAFCRCYGIGIGEGNEKTLYRFSDFKFSQCMKFIYSVDRDQNGIVGSDSCIFSISYHQHKVEGSNERILPRFPDFTFSQYSGIQLSNLWIPAFFTTSPAQG
jgi:hypothetical protein